MKAFKKRLMVTTTVLSVFLLSGCGSSDKKKETTADGTLGKVTWMNILYQTTPPNTVIQDKVKEITGTEVDFTWVPAVSETEKINTALASDSLADIVTLSPNLMSTSSVRNAMNSGMFWEVSDYLDDYPNLKNIPDYARESSSIDGKLYGVPRKSDIARMGVIVRQDWLDNLNMKMPETLDELMVVAKAFTENDPDGNGKNDTTGFIERNELKYGMFKTLAVYFGAPNEFGIDEKTGDFHTDFQTEGYIEAMEYMKEAYDNGYMNKDFLTTAPNNQQEKFVQGKGGIYITGVFQPKNVLDLAKGIQDDMRLTTSITMTAKGQDIRAWSDSNGVAGVFAIPKSNVPTEEDLKKVLTFLDEWCGEEISNLLSNGIEGDHYTVAKVEDGISYTEPINVDDKNAALAAYNGSAFKWTPLTVELLDVPEATLIANEQLIELEDYAVFDPTIGLSSSLANEQGSELRKSIDDATNKYILGQIDREGFKAAVSTWENAGGNQILKEYKEAYELAKK